MNTKHSIWKLIFAFIWLSSCNQAHDEISIIRTTWGAEMDEECIETYTFLDESRFEYYNCAMNDLRTGDYIIRQDTLIVHVYHVDNTPSFAGGKGELELRFQYKFLIKRDLLEQIYFKDYKFSHEEIVNNIPFRLIPE